MPQVGAVQGGQPAPFDSGKGSDNLAFLGTFDEAWSHAFGAIADPILNASLTIGIFDHDSAASGSQVASFTLDGVNATATLDALFETPGDGEQVAGQGSEFNIYTIDLLALGLAGDLADGTLNAALELQGPALIDQLSFPGPVFNVVEVDVGTNGANLIFSTLTIETRDQQPPVLPAPATLALLGLGLLGVLTGRARRG